MHEEAMERRLAAIVAADVANYSLLLAADEIGTLTELKRLQSEIIDPAVHSYRGRIVRLMGDGSLLSFDSALNAVRFAIDVQRSMAARRTAAPIESQIKFRMGANLGDIVQDKYDVHGEGINVAVRLEELAPPGGICLSDSIYLQIKNALAEDLLPIGQRQLKHIADPVLVWRWQPPGIGAQPAMRPHAPQRHAHGRQILDPKVTSLLVDLHLRSAKLALSEAFDAMLASPNEGRRLSLRDIHRIMADRLAAAGELLLPISVERRPDVARLRSGASSSLPLGDYLEDRFDGRDMFFAIRMLRRIQTIIRSRATLSEKRRTLTGLSRHILREANAPQIKSSIRFAFVEA
jgi:class 3 adenylate cyclase